LKATVKVLVFAHPESVGVLVYFLFYIFLYADAVKIYSMFYGTHMGELRSTRIQITGFYARLLPGKRLKPCHI